MNFITRSQLKGHAPQAFSGITYFARNSLLAAMMRNREKVRYIVAPFGFGKSLLAVSYADLINGFNNTVWLDCENPCFLRDLDAHTLLPDLLDSTDVGDLVVLDDVAHVGAARRAHVWKTCLALTQNKREVVLCATPSADPLRGHEGSCICINSQDLLYSEKDLATLRASGTSLRQDVPASCPVVRVPGLVKSEPRTFYHFLQAHIEEMDDPAQTALSFVLLILQRGSFEDAEQVLGCEIGIADIEPENLRAFMSVDAYSGEFSAVGFPMADVISAFKPYMTSIALEAGVNDAGEVAQKLADVLLARGDADRASQVLIALCEQQQRCGWLEQNQDILLSACSLASAEQLYDSLRSERLRQRPVLVAASRIRHLLMEESQSIIEEVVHLAKRADYPLVQRLQCAAYAYLATAEAQQAAELEVLFQSPGAVLKREAETLNEEEKALWIFWTKTAAGTSKIDNIVRKMTAEASGALALACCAHKARLDGCAPEEAPKLKQAVVKLLEEPSSCQNTSALLYLRIELNALGVALDEQSASVLAFAKRADAFSDELEVQRSLYARGKVAKLGAASAAFRAQLAKQGIRSAAAKISVPSLNVQLFGQFDVSLGGSGVDNREFKRQKVRTLLALLVLESGHELSCDNLSERLWPDSTDAQAHHNFYNCVSILRKGLSLSDGSCPYLLRPHGVISLDAHLVRSDVDALRDVCNRLRFSDPDPNAYWHALEQMRGLYLGELLPGEKDEVMIVAAREEWRNRIVNSLIHAGRRLAGVGDTTVALALAEQALVYNPQREDCYEHLMSLQARCGQRPAAIETWIRYRTFLKHELGLDPSRRVSRLYDRIINETM